MEDPVNEIKDVVNQLASSDSPDIQRSAVYKYYAPNAGFRHPLSYVEPGVLSREYILGIYQWYRVMSPHVSIHLDNVVRDERHNVLLLDISLRFHLAILPIEPAPSRLLVRLTLKEECGLHRITMQEDFFHPDDLAASIFPPIIPFLRFSLRAFSAASNICAKTAQVLGYWRPSTTDLSREREYEDKNNINKTEVSHHEEPPNIQGMPSEKSPNDPGPKRKKKKNQSPGKIVDLQNLPPNTET